MRLILNKPYTHHVEHTRILFTSICLTLHIHTQTTYQTPLGTFPFNAPHTSHTHTTHSTHLRTFPTLLRHFTNPSCDILFIAIPSRSSSYDCGHAGPLRHFCLFRNVVFNGFVRFLMFVRGFSRFCEVYERFSEVL